MKWCSINTSIIWLWNGISSQVWIPGCPQRLHVFQHHCLTVLRLSHVCVWICWFTSLCRYRPKSEFVHPTDFSLLWTCVCACAAVCAMFCLSEVFILKCWIQCFWSSTYRDKKSEYICFCNTMHNDSFYFFKHPLVSLWVLWNCDTELRHYDFSSSNCVMKCWDPPTSSAESDFRQDTEWLWVISTRQV